MARRRPTESSSPRRLPTESSEQRDLVRHLRRSRVLHAAVPNGANVSRTERSRLVAEGLVAGVPDLLVFDLPDHLPTAPLGLTPQDWDVARVVGEALGSHPDPWKILKALGYPRGAAIELKRQDGGRGLSAAQEKWLHRLRALGWWAGEAHGSQAAQELLRSWGWEVQ